MGYRLKAFLVLTFFIFGCNSLPGVEVVPRPETEIIAPPPQVVSTTLPENAVVATAEIVAAQATADAVATQAAVTATPTSTPTPAGSPTPTLTPTRLFANLSTSSNSTEALPYHGPLVMLVVFFCIMIPWGLFQIGYISYAQPRGLDITEVLVKGQDGLFLSVVLSMTARRTFNLTSPFTRWRRVTSFVSKTLEQELIQSALKYPTVDELEKNLKTITDGFFEEPVVQELWTDFGVQVIRFNVETRYPQETIDALNRKAEAAAGGQAFLAYTAAAHLDPSAPESRELYRVFQETSGQVDAARNLGGGITNLANILGQKTKSDKDSSSDDK